MSRAVEEWQGKTPDTAIPVRVQLRVYERSGGRCAICSRKVSGRADYQIDHRVALINGGSNAESNLQVACSWCHGVKTREDVALKSKAARVRAKHLGLHKPKNPFPGSKLSKWKKPFNSPAIRRDAQ